MIFITDSFSLPASEVSITQIRAQGAGGQNVNKVSSAVHIRFNIHKSSLPDYAKTKLLSLNDNRLNQQGEIIIKAQSFRSYEKNKEDGIQRLSTLIRRSLQKKKRRKPTKPSKSSQKKRLDKKNLHGKLKKLRKKVQPG